MISILTRTFFLLEGIGKGIPATNLTPPSTRTLLEPRHAATCVCAAARAVDSGPCSDAHVFKIVWEAFPKLYGASVASVQFARTRP